MSMCSTGKPLFDGFINFQGQGNESACEKTVSVKAGETLDFAVGWGNGQYRRRHHGDCRHDSRPTGKTYDAARDFSNEKNPQGPWSYG